MLLDLLQALATPAPLAHRRLGCVGDSIRTGSRSRRRLLHQVAGFSDWRP